MHVLVPDHDFQQLHGHHMDVCVDTICNLSNLHSIAARSELLAKSELLDDVLPILSRLLLSQQCPKNPSNDSIYRLHALPSDGPPVHVVAY